MTKVIYNVYIIIDGNEANLNPRNLAPWGEIDFNEQVTRGQRVTVSWTREKELLSKLFYRVVAISKTKNADKLILINTGREDYKS